MSGIGVRPVVERGIERQRFLPTAADRRGIRIARKAKRGEQCKGDRFYGAGFWNLIGIETPMIARWRGARRASGNRPS